jgi:hypothetical protein
MNLAQLRTELAAARTDLRAAKDELETIRAIVEFNAPIDGKNEGERKRQMEYHLARHADYQQAIGDVRTCESAVDEIQAQIAVAEDEQLAAKISAVNRMADALMAVARTKPVDSIIVDAALPDDWYNK